VVALKSVLGPKPHEAFLVLNDLRHARLRQPLGEHPPELKIVSIDEGHLLREPPRVQDVVRRRRSAVLACLGEHGGCAEHAGNGSTSHHDSNYGAFGVAVVMTVKVV